MEAYHCASCGGWHIGHSTWREGIKQRSNEHCGDVPKLPPYDEWIQTFGAAGAAFRRAVVRERELELARWADDGGVIPAGREA